MSLKHAVVGDSITPLEKVYMLPYDTVLDQATLTDLTVHGHSRVPLYRGSKHNIRGMVLVKRLILLDSGTKRPIAPFATRKPLAVPPSFSMFEILTEFQKGRSHLALVSNQWMTILDCWREDKDFPPEVVVEGILTMEDVLEKLLGVAIQDETDVLVFRRGTHSKTLAKLNTKLNQDEGMSVTSPGRSPITLMMMNRARKADDSEQKIFRQQVEDHRKRKMSDGQSHALSDVGISVEINTFSGGGSSGSSSGSGYTNFSDASSTTTASSSIEAREY